MNCTVGPSSEVRPFRVETYWEGGRATALAAGKAPPEVSIPVGFTTFPGVLAAFRSVR